MKRRSLLRGLLGLPMLPLAKYLPLPSRTVIAQAGILEGMTGLQYVGGDQTSIWFVNWGENTKFLGQSPGWRAVEDSKVLAKMADDLESKFFYDNYPIIPIYPQLSVQEKIRRAVRSAVGHQ